MELFNVNCKSCGGKIDLESLSHINNQKIVCPYCGNIFFLNAKHSKIGAKLEAELERVNIQEKKEGSKAEWDFKNKQAERKYNSKIGLIGLIVVLCILIPLFFTSHSGIEVTSSEHALRGENYKVVQMKLKDMGFKNIESEKIKDLKFGILSDQGDVKEVTINGKSDFSENDRYPKDAKVKIFYHAFKN